ncbi:MAG TPA: ABC transporter permease [Lachnospiraceae bacterium]|nr:ABC transporter permease [Lachnospiraceae bacterium]
MRNPLLKRIPRELKGELGKYIVIFLFMILVIGFISGFLVAANSMITAYNESFEKYNVEYGHFITKDEPGAAALDGIAEDGDVDIDDQPYVEPVVSAIETKEDISSSNNVVTGTGSDGTSVSGSSTLRLFKKRQNVNLECLMKGEFPASDSEVAIDRMYADNNHYSVGDILDIGGQKMKVSGLVALSDYSALFSSNSDMMFDAVLFGVGVVTDEGFKRFEDAHLKVTYEYVWDYHRTPVDEKDEIDMAEELMKTVVRYLTPEDYLPRYANQAINFTGEDFGGDSQMMKVILYVLIVVLAFVFSITIRHTITRESAVIGTLRASGYTKGEILRHYLALPVIVTLISAIIGNILGYTVFKDVGATMYYGSYSLPTFVVLWNAEAFLLTTVIPVLIMFVINLISIHHALRLSPLRFLRHDLTKKKRSKAIRLPRWKFFGRFRLRIILQNLGNYVTMFVGIMLANVFLLFGMMMGPLLTHYQDEIIDTMPAKYQYILKTQIDTRIATAEKFCISTLNYYPSGEKDDSKEGFSIYGIEENSKYIKVQLPTDGTVAISDGIKQKYGIDVGDELTLHEVYESKDYTFKVGRVVSFPSSLALFMPRKTFNETLKPEMSITDVMNDPEMLLHRLATPPEYEYYNAYFSNRELVDIDDKYVQTLITETDMTKVSRQLDVSMGTLFQLWNVFAIILFALLIYLLTKLVLERNTTSISMVKILGYRNSEVAGLYLMATTWVVVLSILLSFTIITPVIVWLYHIFMQKMSGWLTIWIGWETYLKMFLLGAIAYGLVATLQFIKIRRIPMDEALKNVE